MPIERGHGICLEIICMRKVCCAFFSLSSWILRLWQRSPPEWHLQITQQKVPSPLTRVLPFCTQWDLQAFCHIITANPLKIPPPPTKPIWIVMCDESLSEEPHSQGGSWEGKRRKSYVYYRCLGMYNSFYLFIGVYYVWFWIWLLAFRYTRTFVSGVVLTWRWLALGLSLCTCAEHGS